MSKEYHQYIPIDLNYNASSIRHSLRDIVEIILNNKEYCSNCGSILPELQIEYKDKVYRFTCYEVNDNKDEEIIEEDTNIYRSIGFKKHILTTDYVKLKNYLNINFKEK